MEVSLGRFSQNNYMGFSFCSPHIRQRLSLHAGNLQKRTQTPRCLHVDTLARHWDTSLCDQLSSWRALGNNPITDPHGCHQPCHHCLSLSSSRRVQVGETRYCVRSCLCRYRCNVANNTIPHHRNTWRSSR